MKKSRKREQKQNGQKKCTMYSHPEYSDKEKMAFRLFGRSPRKHVQLSKFDSFAEQMMEIEYKCIENIIIHIIMLVHKSLCVNFQNETFHTEKVLYVCQQFNAILQDRKLKLHFHGDRLRSFEDVMATIANVHCPNDWLSGLHKKLCITTDKFVNMNLCIYIEALKKTNKQFSINTSSVTNRDLQQTIDLYTGHPINDIVFQLEE